LIVWGRQRPSEIQNNSVCPQGRPLAGAGTQAAAEETPGLTMQAENKITIFHAKADGTYWGHLLG
jgi:hypothetical protein